MNKNNYKETVRGQRSERDWGGPQHNQTKQIEEGRNPLCLPARAEPEVSLRQKKNVSGTLGVRNRSEKPVGRSVNTHVCAHISYTHVHTAFYCTAPFQGCFSIHRRRAYLFL